MTVQEKAALTLGFLLLAVLTAVMLGPHGWIADLAEWIHQPRDYRR